MRSSNDLSNANWINRSMNDRPKSDIYIAVCGDDADQGIISVPFTTLHRARQAVHALRSDGWMDHLTVCEQAGEYRVNGLEVDPRDNNTIWYANGEVILNGGLTLPSENF